MSPVLRADYTPPAFWVDETSLVFELNPERTVVTATLMIMTINTMCHATMNTSGLSVFRRPMPSVLRVWSSFSNS